MVGSDSILDSVKKVLNVGSDDTDFDTDILMHINSVFSVLQQLGIGPEDGFYIEDSGPTWSDYLGEDALHINMVRSYLVAKVRILFDPPVSSAVMESLNRICSEFEWRANVAAENKALEDEKNESDIGN
jgi:hypothetical protein